MAFPGWRLIAEILFLTNCLFVSAYVGHGENIRKKLSMDFESKLKFLRRFSVKTIRSSDGDIIDCVDVYKQPAFDNPFLLNHSIQMKPAYVPGADNIDARNKSSSRKPLQIWRKSGSCPVGTIPIRRVRKHDLLKSGNIESFRRKVNEFPNGSYMRQTYRPRTLVINNTTIALSHHSNHSAAILVATVFHYVGSRGTLNIWNPRVASLEEYTTSQIWLLAGDPDDYESVESGWMVNPKLYGDKQTRFFIHWTNDGSHKTGCFDLLCSGFVQTSHEIALGAALCPLSSDGGLQYDITVQISMDPKTSNWWLRVNDETNLGYWPASLFRYLRSGATLAQWGGEVYSPKVRQVPHTKAAIGSGNWPQALYGYASYIAHIRAMDYSYIWKYPRYVGTLSDEPNCYAAYHYVPGFMEEPTLYFGGPGGFRNPRCP